VAHALRAAQPNLELAYIGGARGLERRLVGAAGELPYHQLFVRSLRTTGRDAHLLLDPIRLGLSAPQAYRLLGRLRPAAIFTTGGYLALPLVAAARARRIPSVVWEGNVVPGRATRAVGRLATRVAVSFPPTLRAFDRRAFVSGTPIRSMAGIDRTAARASMGLAPDDRMLLVFGGSQAVARMTTALHGALTTVTRDWVVVHLAGEAGMAVARDAAEQLPADQRARYRPIPFLTDGMGEALVAADLVLGRAGSSTCAEVAAVGVASILVPYPHAGDHQRANAAWLADHGAARVVDDAALTTARLEAELAELGDPAIRHALADAARDLGQPAAADVIAAALLELAVAGRT
jgi:UDP-N-acetylglucosamine--N-acetylmuramyl-(pentapeptide) pyrophosphoryl-undecaprenol N-acetylglucosamine transferase